MKQLWSPQELDDFWLLSDSDQAEEAFLKDGTPAAPQPQSQTQALFVVGQTS